MNLDTFMKNSCVNTTCHSLLFCDQSENLHTTGGPDCGCQILTGPVAQSAVLMLDLINLIIHYLSTETSTLCSILTKAGWLT